MSEFEFFYHYNNDYCVLIEAQNLEEAFRKFYAMPNKWKELTNTDCYISLVYESSNRLGPDGYPINEAHFFEKGKKLIDPHELRR